MQIKNKKGKMIIKCEANEISLFAGIIHLSSFAINQAEKHPELDEVIKELDSAQKEIMATILRLFPEIEKECK